MGDYIISGSTNAGTKTPVNQDSMFAGTTQTAKGEAVFAIVCDGMGGTQAGELASASIIDAFRKWFYAKCDLESAWVPESFEVHSEWTDIICFCNRKIIEYGENNGITLGSTIVVLLICSDNILLMNVGDSRAYRVSDMVEKLSHDHSVVGMDIEKGLISEEEAKRDTRNNILTQCVGIRSEIDPYFMSFPYRPGCYVLCSDGFYNKISNDEIMQFLNREMDQAGLELSLNYLTELDRSRGEKDDISAIAVIV